MLEKQIPVLIKPTPERAEGFVSSKVSADKPMTRVRRLKPSIVMNLKNSRQQREIDKKNGAISAAE
jgi:hypothetical protein